MKIINYFLQSIFIYFFFLIGIILRLNLSRKIFAFLFCVLGPLFKSKKIIQNNMQIFSQNAKNFDEDKLVKNMWKNYGMTFIEYLFLGYFRNNTSHVNFEGKDNLMEITKNNKPVIFVSGHFANFELMSMEITKKNIPLATIYRPLNNFFLNPLMEYLRKKMFVKIKLKRNQRC